MELIVAFDQELEDNKDLSNMEIIEINN